MQALSGHTLLHRVAARIVAKRLEELGHSDVAVASRPGELGVAVDLRSRGARPLAVKLKCDPYYGSDPQTIADRAYPYYRGESDTLALEAVADSATRAPGWALSSEADELWYYRVAIAAPEADVLALFAERDEVFFAELPVVADDAIVLPMHSVNSWFAANLDRFPSRPVTGADGSSWQRLVPRATLLGAVPGVRHEGPVFSTLSA